MVDSTGGQKLFSVRSTRMQDWPVLRLMLPEAVYFGSAVITLVAIENATDLVVGAIAVSRELRTTPVSGAKIALYVLPPFYHRGIEEQLLVAAGNIVGPTGGRALYTWGIIEANSQAAHFWKRHGFDQAEIVREGRTDVARGLKYLEPFWQHLLKRGKVPANIEVARLDRIDPARIAAIYVQHIGGSYEKIFRELTGQSDIRYEPAVSPVVMLGSKMVGLILARRMPGNIALVEAVIIDKGYRGGWANIFLKREGWRNCVDVGIHTVLYYTHGKHQDTRRFVDKVGTTIRDFEEPYRILNPG
jgi:GNAT superfamily N-acetyltransferase